MKYPLKCFVMYFYNTKSFKNLCHLIFHDIEKDFPALLNEIAVNICSIYNCRGFVCSFCCFVQKCKFPARPISIRTIIKIRMMIFLLISLQYFMKDKWFRQQIQLFKQWILWICPLRSLSLQYLHIKSFQVSKQVQSDLTSNMLLNIIILKC